MSSSANSNMTSTTTRIRNLHFDGTPKSFEAFEVKFKAYLRLKKIKLDVVSEGQEEENEEIFAELVQMLDPSSLALIMRDGAEDGRKAMKILRDHYLPKGKPRIIALYTELTCISKLGSESITDYIIRAETAASQLRDAGETISDGLLVSMALKGLPRDFHSFVTVITQVDEMTFQSFKMKLRNFEDTIKMGEEKPTATSVMHISDKSTNPKLKFSGKCYKCGKIGHRASDCYAKKWCNICKANSHSTNECRKAQQKNKAHAKSMEEKEDEHSFAFVVSESKSEICTEDILVDCGATAHILNDESMFLDFDETFDSKTHVIEMADGRRARGLAQKKGTASVNLKDNEGRIHACKLFNTLYVPSFKQNLFSVQAALANGAEINFKENDTSLRSGNTKFDFLKKGKLYFLKTYVATSTAKVCRSLQEWHTIMGHCNKEDILKLESVTKGMNISDKKDFNCDVCVKSKMTQTINRAPDARAKAPLDLIHLDLTGPIEPVSNDFKYVLGCTDDFSGIVIPYMLKNKSDTPKAFEKFIADTRPYGDIKCVRSDGGGEFSSEIFEALLIKNKIKHEKSAPYSPHQNGTAERTFRTIFEMARCILSDANLPKSLWPYAVMCSAHTRNRCFNKRNQKTPFESLTGKQPDMSKMFKFGSKCFAFIQNPKKLSDRAEEGIFVGYDKESPAYLVYFPENQKVKRVRCIKCFNDKTEDSFVDKGDEISNDLLILEKSNMNENPEQNVLQNVPDIDSDNTETRGDSEHLPSRISCDDNARKSKRNVKLPKHFDDFITDNNDFDNFIGCTIDYCFLCVDVPKCYDDAIIHVKSNEWKKAMDAEMIALRENNTFDLVTLPPDRKAIQSRWVYAEKSMSDETVNKYKARFVAKGCSQKADIDYHEIFSPTASMASIRSVAQIAINENMNVHQMDVKSAYLNAPIDVEIYVQQPKGYEVYDDNGDKLVLKLNKSLYGLKQSGRNWNNMLHDYLMSQGFKQSLTDTCVYTKHTKDSLSITLIWVDDILIASNSDSCLYDIKQAFKDNFNMKDLGTISHFLGIDFVFEKDEISMSQARYIEKLLERFNMHNCKAKLTPCDPNINNICNESTEATNATLYREIIGSLIYAMTGTRPDLCYVVTKLSQYMSEPNKNHMSMAKHVLRYLKGTINEKLIFRSNKRELEILGFCDADWANSGDRRSITGYGFQLNPNGPLISWKCKKQPTVALSTCEAEYMSLAAAAQEGKFLISLFSDLMGENLQHFLLYCDNQGSIALAKNPIQHQRSKHIDIRYHFVREMIKDDIMILQYVPTDENIADMFTKHIHSPKLKKFKSLIMGL